MSYYIIIEKDEGFAVAEVPDDESAEEAALEAGAILIDEGPYDSYQDAQDVLLTLPNPYEKD